MARRNWLVAGLLALLVTGCSAGRVDPNDPVAACNASAQSDPDVAAVRNKQLGSEYAAQLYARDYKQALNIAVDRCLATKGIARPGGVEAVRRD